MAVEIYTAQDSTEPYDPKVAVAFGLDCAVAARFGNVVLDVNQDKLHAALKAGGLTDQQCRDYPTIFTFAVDNETVGTFLRSPSFNDGQPAMVLFMHPYRVVPAKDAAHEARHFADYLQKHESVLSEKQIKHRKIGTCVIAATMLASFAGSLIGTHPWIIDNMTSTAILAGQQLIIGDFLLSTALKMEYSSRSEEKRARNAEKNINDSSGLVRMIVPIQDRLNFKASPKRDNFRRILHNVITIAKSVVIPDFSR